MKYLLLLSGFVFVNLNAQNLPVETIGIFSYTLSDNRASIYYKDKLLIEDVDYPNSEQYSEGKLWVYRGEKVGILDSNGLLLPIDYDLIRQEVFAQYTASGQLENRILYILTRQSSEPNDKHLVQHTVVNEHAGRITAQPFANIQLSHYDAEKVMVCEGYNGKLFRLFSNGKIESLPWTTYSNYYTYSIATRDGKTYLLDGTDRLLMTCDTILYPMVEFQDFDETGEIYVHKVSTDNGYLTVVEKDKYAIWSVDERKLITSWFDEYVWAEPSYMLSEPVIMIFGGEKFAIRGQNAPATTALPYAVVERINPSYVLAKSAHSPSRDIFAVKSGVVQKIGSCADVIPGFLYSNSIDKSMQDVLVVLDTLGKHHIILSDKSFISLQADSLIYSGNDVLDFRQNGSWGGLHLLTGIIYPPTLPEPNRISYLVDLHLLITEEADGYRTHRGDVIYSLAMSDNIAKKNGRYGLRTWSELPSHESEELWGISPVYRKLDPQWEYGVMIAQGQDKKFGLIRFNGDTLLPFVYDEITREPAEGTDNYCFLRVAKESSYTLYEVNQGNLLPGSYDQIEFDDRLGFVLHSGDKVGLADVALRVIYPVEYQAIVLWTMDDQPLLEVRKNDKWYVVPFDDVPPPYWRMELQPGYDLILGVQGIVIDSTGYITRRIVEPAGSMAVSQLTIPYENVQVYEGKFYIRDAKGKLLHRRNFTLLQSEYSDPEFLADIVGSEYHGTIHYYSLYSTANYSRDQW